MPSSRALLPLPVVVLVAACGAREAPSAETPNGSTSAGETSSGNTSAGTSGGAPTQPGALDASTGGASPGAEPIREPFVDTFDDATLAGWTVLVPQGNAARVDVASGFLRITVPTFSTWFNADRAPFVHRAVKGDFRLTAAVRARRASDDAPPTDEYQFAGLLARSPAGGAENHVFIVVGRYDTSLAHETKSTRNGQSVKDYESAPSSDAQLRICRVGSRFRLYQRPYAGGAWSLEEEYDRADLPAELQVGPMAYAYEYRIETQDFRGSFDWVSLGPVSSAAACTED